MSLVFFDGFEAEAMPSVKGWVASTRSSDQYLAWDTSVKRSGYASVRLHGNYYKGYDSGWIQVTRTLDPQPTYIVGFGMMHAWTAANQDQVFFGIGNADGSRWLRLVQSYSSKLLSITNNGVVIATGTTQIHPNTWYYLQVKATTDPVNGLMSVLLGNQSEIHITNINTTSTNNKIDRVYWYVYALMFNNDQHLWLDDVYIVNPAIPPMDDFIGVCSIAGSRPTANGDQMHFEVVGNENHWDAVDETAANTSDYIYGDGMNEKALFQMQDVTTIGDIKGLLVHDYAARSEEGQGASKYRMVLRNEADQEYESPDVVLSNATWAVHTWILENNPITDTTWDMSSINDLQIGVKITQVD